MAKIEITRLKNGSFQNVTKKEAGSSLIELCLLKIILKEMTDSKKEFFVADVFDVPLYVVPENESVISFSLETPASSCRLLVLLQDEEHEKCNPRDLDLLNKIADWKDLNLKRSEVFVVNLAKQEVRFISLLKQFSPKNVIGFGIQPGEIKLHIECDANTLFKFRDVNFIFTSSLSELSIDDKLKSKFFKAALRPMFK
jgi:hypothetical protein